MQKNIIHKILLTITCLLLLCCFYFYYKEYQLKQPCHDISIKLEKSTY